MKQLPKEYIGVELSNATMRSEDLIPAFMNFLEQVSDICEIGDEVTAIQEEIAKLEFEEKTGYGTYYTDESQEQAAWILNEDIWNLLDSIAPEFCYFGANEGDGACYGFWTSDEDLTDTINVRFRNIEADPWNFDEVRKELENVLELMDEHGR